ncbi:MAG TPA: hypothetical protein VEL11_16245, partial [Candidatus Bathyarchaeia archaeon]|nr:hypothetical protein [Candidatus Bathyarchaeia archaeon]
RHDNPTLLLIGSTVKNGDIVLARDRHPHYFAVWREERFMRRAPDIGNVFYGIGRRIILNKHFLDV